MCYGYAHKGLLLGSLWWHVLCVLSSCFFHKFSKKVANFRFGKCAMSTPIRASSWAPSGGTFYVCGACVSLNSQVFKKVKIFLFCKDPRR